MDDQQLHPILSHYIAWLKSHEKILIVVLSAWLVWHVYGKGIDAWIEHDKRIATVAEEKVKTDQTANQQLSQQVADLKQQLQSVAAQAQAKQAERVVIVQQQKQQNDKAAPSDLAIETTKLLNIDQTEVTTLDDKLLFSNLAAHVNVNALVDLSAAQAEIADDKKVNQACSDVVLKQGVLITGLNTQLTDEQSAHKADVNLEKAKAKKAWRNGFKWGAITGFVGGIFVTHKP